MAAKSELRIRLFGGFEIWSGDRQLAGFESQKVRALLAYLVCHRKRTFSRDHLAGLLWPDKDTEAARHALRQAVYNLKSVLTNGAVENGIRSSPSGLELNPEVSIWLDVDTFEEALRRSRSRGAADPHQLTIAAQLYRGELLAGFFVKDCTAFEDWLVGEQERLRETAVEVLRTLVDLYRRRGEPRFAIHYARRLVAIEPLSEEAYRELMRLYGMTGRRSRALAEYEKLQTMLRTELGVAPLAETRALHESILLDVMEDVAPNDEAEPIGPLIPLAGRGELLAALRDRWQSALDGGSRLTLVAGEDGVGKTRVIKSLLDSVTTQRRATVLKGRCFELGMPIPYLPFRQVIGNAVTEEADLAEQALGALPDDVLVDLALLFPDLRELKPDLPAALLPPGEAARDRLFQSVTRFLLELCAALEEGEPLILFLDDLHLADRDSFDLLEHLLTSLQRCPVWIVAAYQSGETGPDHPLARLERLPGGATEVRVERLAPPALREIAESLVGGEQAPILAHLLTSHAGGLPLAVTELINFLWDEGALVPREGGEWRLVEGDSGPLHLFRTGSLAQAILRRIQRLPSSTRRLAALAAVAGQSFDPSLLERAEEEHAVVVEVGLEVMLKRWLIRQFTPYWSSGRRERDIVRWARGTRRGSFEFAHSRIRSAIYDDIDPPRRQTLHGQIGSALEALHGDKAERVCEILAHHFTTAGMWEKAAVYLQMAAAKARALKAEETASHYERLAADVRGRLQASTVGGP